MMTGFLIFAVVGSMAIEAGKDDHVAEIRGMAKKMMRTKNAGSDSAYCEYVTISQVDGCSGPNRNAVRYKVTRKGLIEAWDYRSPGQNGEPIGYYQGRIEDEQWRT